MGMLGVWKFWLVTLPAETVGIVPRHRSARTLCQAGNPVKFLLRVNQTGAALSGFILWPVSSLIQTYEEAF